MNLGSRRGVHHSAVRSPILPSVGKHAAPRHSGPRWSVIALSAGMGLASLAGGVVFGLIGPGLPSINVTSPVNAGTLPPVSVANDSGVTRLTQGDSGSQTTGGEEFTPRSITILGVGDILVHREILQQAQSDGAGDVDFLPQLEGIRPLVESADLAVCHMEYPLGSREGPWSVWPDPVNAPPQLADAIADLGFDACSTASNHSLAQGAAGVNSTIDALDAAGIPFAGTARTFEDSQRITILDIQGVSVALLSYTYSFNGIPRPYEWCCNLIDDERIVADASRARSQGAQLVVVSLHQGVEGVVPPTSEQQTTTTRLAESGVVDLVLGHHAHVVQPVTRIGDMWVAFGHGNLLSAQSRRDPRTGDGLLTMFTFEERPDGSFEGTSAVGYALENEDFPFRVIPVGTEGSTSTRAELTWQRVSEQALLAGDTSGFRLERWSPTQIG